MAGSRARSVGPQRADRLLDEHSRQREVLGGLHREACAHPEFPTTMRILCPTDFSMPARAAAQLAVALARPTIGSVELLHVVPPRTTDIGAVATGASVREDKVCSDARARLAAECRELATDGVEVTSWLDEGEVESSILSRAKAIGAELGIVMGAHSQPCSSASSSAAPPSEPCAAPIGRCSSCHPARHCPTGEQTGRGDSVSWWRSTAGPQAAARSTS